MRFLIVVALLFGACKSDSKSGAGTSSSAASASKLTLVDATDKTNKVNVEFAVPSSWKTDPNAPPPSWRADDDSWFSLVYEDLGGNDDAARLKHVIKAQWSDAELASGATRKDYPDGRVWISKPQDNGNIHGRLFIPAPHGVIMGLVTVKDPKLVDGARSAYEALKIAP